ATGKPVTVTSTGIPSAESLASADEKIESLASARADSVVLTPSETASLLERSLQPYSRSFFDSMEVRLGDGLIGLTAVIRTDRLPAGLLGPFGMAVREREPVSADGTIRVTTPGHGIWEVRRLEVRDIPLPRDAVPRLLGRATGDSASGQVPLTLPESVAALRVRPGGVTLYRAEP